MGCGSPAVLPAGIRRLSIALECHPRGEKPTKGAIQVRGRQVGDPDFWLAVKMAASSTVTNRNLLAALNLERSPAGDIEAMPEGTSANRPTRVVSLLVTVVCLLIGMPYAMVAASLEGWRRQLLLAAVPLPLWTSLLVRTAAWFVLLQDNGLINSSLIALGLTSQPIPLTFNRVGAIPAPSA
jgi:putative spermidine/putrescine transport system permease protein